MAELKTRPDDSSVAAFLSSIDNEQRRGDSFRMLELMRDITGEAPRMWGPAIVGYGSCRYRYKSGREGDWFLTGFSPRKQALTLYLMSGLARSAEQVASLGTFKRGKGCLYLKKLDDVDPARLEALIRDSVAHLRQGGTMEFG